MCNPISTFGMDGMIPLHELEKFDKSVNNFHKYCENTTNEVRGLELFRHSIDIKEENVPILEYREDNVEEAGNHSNSYSEIECKVEDLHHAIDIKEDASIQECQPTRECKLKRSKKIFMCDICDYKCSRKGHLIVHSRRKHTGEKPFGCDICDFKCVVKEGLTLHSKIHTGEGLIPCNICDYKCTSTGRLNIHLVTHTGEKSFTCEICGHKSTQTGSLKRHLRTHTGEKPFSCQICDYKCAVRGTLRKHVKTHTDEKLFVCVICGYKCSHERSLNIHTRKHFV